MEIIFDWIVLNYVELLGAILGIIGVYFQVKQNVWVWPLSIIASLLYVFVFFQARFYALMSLQFYFIGVSIFGWYQWLNPGKKKRDSTKKNQLGIIRMNLNRTISYGIFFIILSAALYWFMKELTDDSAPFWSGIITSLSFVASLMLARKIIEQWVVWIVADTIAVVLYFYQGLYPSTVFYFILIIMAIFGYLQWKKVLIANHDS